MTFSIGDTVRVTRGDLQGRVGTVRRIPGGSDRGSTTYGIAFQGESAISSFRDSNLESAPIGFLLPEFMMAEGVIHPLAEEPYELISGGFMGKRRRYERNDTIGTPPFGMSDEGRASCDFRRFPVKHEGKVVAGIWSRFEPHAEHFAEVVERVRMR